MAWFRPVDARTTRKWLARLLLAAGVALTLNSSWIYAKALLAQHLIASAWQQTLHTSAPVKPWPWADTWPVARLQIPHRDVDLYVLEGLHGSTLAFGPGQLTVTATTNEIPGRIVAGHRDTHFGFVRDLVWREELFVTDSGGNTLRYSVVDLQVVDSREQMLELTAPQLQLVTCYPFDAIDTGGPLRYVVTAIPESSLLTL